MAGRPLLISGVLALTLFTTNARLLAGPVLSERSLFITVRNSSRGTAGALKHALDEVVRMFRGIGISVEWADHKDGDAEEPDSARVPSLNLTVLDRELRELRDPTRAVLGAAPTSAKEPGHLAYVFYESVERMSEAYAVDVVLVLAHVIAHELGHLLLPAGHHSPSGLMHGHWGARDLRAAVWGMQNFSAEETNLIRAALAPSTSSASVRR